MHDLWKKMKKINTKKWHVANQAKQGMVIYCQQKSKSTGKDMTYVQRSNSYTTVKASTCTREIM